MRVLFTTWAWPSHLYALVPLAWACRSAGHEVLVASQPALTQEISRTGLPAATVGTDVDTVGMIRDYLLPSTANETVAEPGQGKGPRALRMLLAHAESMADGLVALARQWRPDVVVFEPTALAGPLAAAAVGVPAVRHLYGTDLLLRARPLLPSALGPLAERHGVTDFDPFGVCTVDPTPPSLQLPAAYSRVPLRYVPYNGQDSRPVTQPPSIGRPRVCVTWGHTIAKLAPARYLAGAVGSALAGTGVEVVVVASREQRPMLGGLPDETRVMVGAPLYRVLPGCDLVVAHGGAGTVLTTMWAGLPMLLVPQLPDHLGHAGRVLNAGAGEVLSRPEATSERIRLEVERLLTDDTRRKAAAAVRREMHEQPTPAATVAVLETVAAGVGLRPTRSP
ncbi:protein IroB [Actinosynnema sp. ALI-1.44]|uniref:nucleotide disphospho-sugar-binding domain-containing protein n=1 Tax=Actinosynnema sp. ALI-1.44 TaxID=1933779 RepID=UPI00097CBF57|nr:nucleotide disphospho-sugar-binding domain-containing protein [Actinosynnema sp. ALI-1.44]ONI77913.1 protein IroB [Actinosynnema sp. ALI-1.44]